MLITRLITPTTPYFRGLITMLVMLIIKTLLQFVKKFLLQFLTVFAEKTSVHLLWTLVIFSDL